MLYLTFRGCHFKKLKIYEAYKVDPVRYPDHEGHVYTPVLDGVQSLTVSKGGITTQPMSAV